MDNPIKKVLVSEEEINNITYPATTKVMLQNIFVLAVDQEYGQGVDKTSQERQRKITLALSPADAEKLHFGDAHGKLRLTLRHPEDKGTEETSSVIRTDIASKTR